MPRRNLCSPCFSKSLGQICRLPLLCSSLLEQAGFCGFARFSMEYAFGLPTSITSMLCENRSNAIPPTYFAGHLPDGITWNVMGVLATSPYNGRNQDPEASRGGVGSTGLRPSWPCGLRGCRSTATAWAWAARAPAILPRSCELRAGGPSAPFGLSRLPRPAACQLLATSNIS